MIRVQLIHWREEEGRERVQSLRKAGFRVEYEADGPAALRAAKDELPDAFLIDLTRLPSHGREMAWALRQSKKTRAIPLVFLGGDPTKLPRIRKELPDAVYGEWSGVSAAIQRALSAPAIEPVVPKQEHFYAAKPLAAKLGVKAGSKLALVDAPKGFERTLGALPEGVMLTRDQRGAADIVLWFVRNEKELTAALPKWKKAAAAGARIWAGWPKKASSLATDLTQDAVRRRPHAHGLVDFKICALDADWSGMCFALRKPAKKA